MLSLYVALVSETDRISPSEITRVGAALQRQAIRDFGSSWDIQAAAYAFIQLEDVPLGYWPIIVEDDINMPGKEISLDQGLRLTNEGTEPNHWSCKRSNSRGLSIDRQILRTSRLDVLLETERQAKKRIKNSKEE